PPGSDQPNPLISKRNIQKKDVFCPYRLIFDPGNGPIAFFGISQHAHPVVLQGVLVFQGRRPPSGLSRSWKNAVTPQGRAFCGAINF
ncbi:MAG TPA: hypothetical protein VGA63_01435, partial [Geopsychrobacteraceae bacterium]